MTELFGRLHPLLVHLPIGFLVLLGLLEALALTLRRPELTATSRTIVALTIPAAIVSAACGWLLAGEGGYDENTLLWHRWLGVSVAAMTVVLFVAHWLEQPKLYRGLLLVTLGLVAVTGHLGGSLVYGSDYFTSPLKKIMGGSKPEPAPANDAATPADPIVAAQSDAVYGRIIQPMFNDYCIGCHGAKKTKGGLRLDSYAGLDKGGKSGAAIVTGSATLSLLCKRLAMPADNDDHMPPDGKKQPTTGEVTLLRWWIDAGASADKTVQELNPAPEALKLIQARTVTQK